MPVEKFPFGTLPSGEEVTGFKLTNSNGVEVQLISYGAAIAKICLPDKNGKVVDVTLGFDNIEGYIGKNPYFAATCGRVCNRIANGKFTVDGKQYQLVQNNGPNCLHGGTKGFDKYVFKVSQLDEKVTFTHTSADGDEGFPGEVTLSVQYCLDDSNQLLVKYHATSTAATPINIANHSYFNLAGNGSGSIKDHELKLFCDHYLPVNDVQIPTGEIVPVKDTQFDFLESRRVGERLAEVDGGGQPGYDHNYCLMGEAGQLRPCAILRDPASGRQLYVQTTMPGVQLYTGNFLNGSVAGKGGVAHGQHSGMCLETQYYPDGINQPRLRSFVLRPEGPEYHERTSYTFYVDGSSPSVA